MDNADSGSEVAIAFKLWENMLSKPLAEDVATKEQALEFFKQCLAAVRYKDSRKP